ncbi:MAG: hypothetical protein JWO36_5448 [Myxococcales bacterium]|nr:hypothetical protein [Myxococcales bacterium]
MTTRDPAIPSPVVDSTALALALTCVFGVVYALIARYAFDRFPYSGDEYSLSLQGEMFARGLFKSITPAHGEWLRVDHVVIDSFVRSKYPPGAPALLALGARQGVAWLVTPLEGVVTLLLVWHAIRRLLGPRPALVGLVALGLAPLFAFEAASFYAHTPGMMCLAAAFSCVAAWSQSGRQRWLVLAGFAIGCTFLVRPLDAILFGVAMLSFRSVRAVVIAGASAVPFVIANFAYQAIQFGSPFSDGYHAYEPTLREIYGNDIAATPMSPLNVVSPTQLWNHLDIYRAMVIDWTLPGTALVALLGAFAIGRAHPARSMRTFSIAIIATFAVVLLPMIADLDDGPRPRYLSSTLIPIAFLTAAGFEPACAAIAARFGRRILRILLTLSIVFGLGNLASFIVDRIPKQWKREGVFKVVEAQHVQPNAVVIVRAQYPSRFARNGPMFDGVLYLSVPPDVGIDTIRQAYPNRQMWEAHEGEPWTLIRVQ